MKAPALDEFRESLQQKKIRHSGDEKEDSASLWAFPFDVTVQLKKQENIGKLYQLWQELKKIWIMSNHDNKNGLH